MTIEIANGGTYTPTAGSNRLVVVVATAQRGSGLGTFSVDTLSLGGQAFLEADLVTYTTDGFRTNLVGVYIIREADIPAGTGLSFVGTFDQTVSPQSFFITTLTGRDQTSLGVGLEINTPGDTSASDVTFTNLAANSDIIGGIHAEFFFLGGDWTVVNATRVQSTVDSQIQFFYNFGVGSGANYNFGPTAHTTESVGGVYVAFPENAGDTTAPELTSPTASDVRATTAVPGVSTDEDNGTLYWGAFPTASTPSDADIVAGTGATDFGSQAVSATGAQTISAATGLSEETAYKFHFIQDDAAANRSTASVSAEFTTESIVDPAAGTVQLDGPQLTPTISGSGTAFQATSGTGSLSKADALAVSTSGTGEVLRNPITGTAALSVTGFTFGASGTGSLPVFAANADGSDGVRGIGRWLGRRR